jgi:hypothetical protein
MMYCRFTDPRKSFKLLQLLLPASMRTEFVSLVHEIVLCHAKTTDENLAQAILHVLLADLCVETLVFLLQRVAVVFEYHRGNPPKTRVAAFVLR